MKELKPCPFCGHIPKLSHAGTATVIQCRNTDCLATIVASDSNVYEDKEYDKVATFRWNRRN